MGDQTMTNVEELFRRVCRAFYEDEVVVVGDLLVREQPKNCLTEDDISKILLLNKQTVNRVLATMKGAKLAKSVTKSDIDPETGKEKSFRAALANKHYYYIDYREFLDVVRYKVHMMRENLKSNIVNEQNLTKWFCSMCGKEYTMFDITSLLMETGGEEPSCVQDDCDSGPLVEQAVERDMQDSAVRQTRFNDAFTDIQNLLGQLNGIEIPTSRPNFAKLGVSEPTAALERKVESENPEEADRIDIGGSLEVVVEMQDDTAGDDEHAESKTKVEMVEAKPVPEWFTKSTVEKSSYEIGGGETKVENPVEVVNLIDDEEDRVEDVEAYEARFYKPKEEAASNADAMVDVGEGDEDGEEEQTVNVAGVPKKLSEINEEDQERMTTEEFELYNSLIQDEFFDY